MWHFTSEQADFWFNLSNIVSLFGVIVSLFGAVAVALGTFGSIKMGALRDQFSNERIAANEAETAKAQATAASAQLELAKLKAPRALDSDQIRRMIAKLLPFAGQQFAMITYWNTQEPTDFTKKIGENVLIPAGWKFVKAERFEALILDFVLRNGPLGHYRNRTRRARISRPKASPAS